MATACWFVGCEVDDLHPGRCLSQRCGHKASASANGSQWFACFFCLTTMKDGAGHAKVSSRIILYHTLRSCGQRLRTDQNWIRNFEQHVLEISSRLLPCFFYNLLYVIPHCQAETFFWNRPSMSVDDPGVLSVQFYPYLLTMMYDVYWCLM